MFFVKKPRLPLFGSSISSFWFTYETWAKVFNLPVQYLTKLLRNRLYWWRFFNKQVKFMITSINCYYVHSSKTFHTFHKMFYMPQIIFEYSLDFSRTFPGMFEDIPRNITFPLFPAFPAFRSPFLYSWFYSYCFNFVIPTSSILKFDNRCLFKNNLQFRSFYIFRDKYCVKIMSWLFWNVSKLYDMNILEEFY